MNHQPFEEWLLNDTPLTPEQKRQLDSHIRACDSCAALVKTEKVMRAMRMASPAPGFLMRFHVRLAAQKAADRRRRWIGSIVFVAGGLTLLTVVGLPFLTSFVAAPAQWITALVQWGVYIFTTLQATAQAGAVILDIIGEVLPPFAWMVLISAIGGLSLLWSVSIWRFVRVPQGA
jgi:anti-sigma factor RsiW